jgi:hypothetical protein
VGEDERSGGGGEAAHETSTAIAVLLAVAAVLAAAIGARAGFLADVGSDKWHEAVRTEIKYGAGLLEDTRFVYQEVAPQAFQVVSSTIQAEELRREAKKNPTVRNLVEGEAGAQEKLAQSIAHATGIDRDKRLLRASPTYDTAGRLAEERNKHPELVKLDAGEVEHEGSELKRQSSLLFATAIPAAFAFLAGAMAHGFGTWRRWLVPLGFALCGISLVLALIVEFSF